MRARWPMRGFGAGCSPAGRGSKDSGRCPRRCWRRRNGGAARCGSAICARPPGSTRTRCSASAKSWRSSGWCSITPSASSTTALLRWKNCSPKRACAVCSQRSHVADALQPPRLVRVSRAMKPARTLYAQARYFWMLLRRFRFTFLMLLVLVFGGGALMHLLLLRAGKPVGLGRAFVTAYFLLFAQPIIDLPDNGPVELLAVLIPPLGITTVAEGLVRFAYLFFALERNDKEWFSLLAQTLKDHVIVCRAGPVG